ncbi:MAG TPA: diaminopimelate epimerase [Steroidobacteraceae bacterium]|jgi:diaminopimelate epimerase|nr:diaminopimelate epimerase [Steroidobacteraceae bacterium]
MQLDFTKMHGLGNDFIVFDAPRTGNLPTPQQWRALSARHTGIGFDQALVIEPPRRAGTQAYYRIFNADGGEVEQCGNGVRCLASFLQRRGALAPDDSEIVLDSPAGLIRARVHGPELVSVDMGVPNFDPKSLPFDASAEAHVYPLAVAGTEVEIGAVSMGNPHAVLTVASVASAPVDRLGPAIEKHPRFPNRVNVGFMEIVDRTHVRLRVFERGVGETLACGTGACAAVAVGRRHGRLDATVEVQLPGGKLELTWPGPGEHIWMKGPTAVSFTGRVEI